MLLDFSATVLLDVLALASRLTLVFVHICGLLSNSDGFLSARDEHIQKMGCLIYIMIDIANNRFCIALNTVHVIVMQTIQRGLQRSESLPSNLLKCLMLDCGTWNIYIAKYY